MLADVPASAWDEVTPAGVDAVWLMGVWERSPAGLELANANAGLQASFTDALPDLRPDDVIGSPYCVRRYVVDASFGGPQARARSSGRPSSPACAAGTRRPCWSPRPTGTWSGPFSSRASTSATTSGSTTGSSAGTCRGARSSARRPGLPVAARPLPGEPRRAAHRGQAARRRPAGRGGGHRDPAGCHLVARGTVRGPASTPAGLPVAPARRATRRRPGRLVPAAAYRRRPPPGTGRRMAAARGGRLARLRFLPQPPGLVLVRRRRRPRRGRGRQPTPGGGQLLR